MNTILVPTSFAPADVAAFRYAVRLAMHYNWSVRLAHVSPIVFGANDAPIFLPLDEMRDALDRFFKSVALTMAEVDFLEKVGFEKVALEGAPVSALLEYAEREKVGLIAIAATRKSGLETTIFGSVSADLARLADCPVLLVPENAVFRGFEDIVFAADFNSLRPVFLDRAMSLAREFRGVVQFVHVGDDVFEDMELKERLFKNLFPDEKTEPAVGWGFSYVEQSAVENGLIEWLTENSARLLILSTRHRGFFESLGHHSVTAEMARKPLVPILVLHEEDAPEAAHFETEKSLRAVATA